MKKASLVLSIAFALAFTSCHKDTIGIILKPHDQDAMMTIMHQTMDTMMMVQTTNDPDIDFARMMIIHHKGTISMANLELQSGQNDSLKRTAQKIINEQQSEIQQMDTILANILIDTSDVSFATEQAENINKMGKTADVQLITGDIDNDFATLMIVHHQAAIDNAYAYLQHGNNLQLITLARNIIINQTGEIEELSNWLVANKR